MLCLLYQRNWKRSSVGRGIHGFFFSKSSMQATGAFCSRSWSEVFELDARVSLVDSIANSRSCKGLVILLVFFSPPFRGGSFTGDDPREEMNLFILVVTLHLLNVFPSYVLPMIRFRVEFDVLISI